MEHKNDDTESLKLSGCPACAKRKRAGELYRESNALLQRIMKDGDPTEAEIKRHDEIGPELDDALSDAAPAGDGEPQAYTCQTCWSYVHKTCKGMSSEYDVSKCWEPHWPDAPASVGIDPAAVAAFRDKLEAWANKISYHSPSGKTIFDIIADLIALLAADTVPMVPLSVVEAMADEAQSMANDYVKDSCPQRTYSSAAAILNGLVSKYCASYRPAPKPDTDIQPLQHEVFCVTSKYRDGKFPGFHKMMHDKLFCGIDDAQSLAETLDLDCDLAVWTLAVAVMDEACMIYGRKPQADAEPVCETCGDARILPKVFNHEPSRPCHDCAPADPAPTMIIKDFDTMRSGDCGNPECPVCGDAAPVPRTPTMEERAAWWLAKRPYASKSMEIRSLAQALTGRYDILVTAWLAERKDGDK